MTGRWISLPCSSVYCTPLDCDETVKTSCFVRPLQRVLFNVLSPHDSTHFLWRSIWRNKVRLRVMFFAWSATLGTLTMNNLRKQCIIMLDWCFMCKRSGKSIDHLYSIVRLLVSYGLPFSAFLH